MPGCDKVFYGLIAVVINSTEYQTLSALLQVFI